MKWTHLFYAIIFEQCSRKSTALPKAGSKSHEVTWKYNFGKALNNTIPRAHTSVIRAIYPPKGNDGRNHFYYEQPRHFIENYLFVDCLNGLNYFELLRLESSTFYRILAKIMIMTYNGKKEGHNEPEEATYINQEVG